MPATLPLLGDLLLRLHQSAPRMPVDRFQDWALNQVKPVLPFDAAFWGGGHEPAEAVVLHYVHLHNLPEGMTEAWERNKEKTFRLTQTMIDHADRSVCLNHDVFSQDESYAPFWQVFNVAHILCMYLRDPVAKLYHVISFYRFHGSPPYSEQETRLHEALIPHLVATYQQNRLASMPPGADIEQRPVAAAADLRGTLHFTEPGFGELLRKEWPQWQGPELPDAILRLLDNPPARHVGQGVVAHAERMHDLYRVRLRTKTKADELSSRLLDVARLFAGGRSHKEISRQLDISPATVRNHLSHIYERLGISNKAELAMLLHDAAG